MKSELTPEQSVDDGFQDELKPGTKLLHGQYVIEQFLNNGGFGITYLARDSLDRLVVIKECFPESICGRSNSTVRVRSRTQAEAFRTIVDLFIEEARSLARLSHPNIVGVHQVFEDNDTAYMAMDFVEGRDLLDIADGVTDLEPAALEQIALKLLDAVEFIHDVGVLHRDIAPDNILLSGDNEPVLIDFGAARENVSVATSYLGSMRTVKDGYSPQEFYSNNSDQHPSSDLYSLAASLYHVIAKELPANAQARLSAIASGDADPYVSISRRASGYSEPFLDAIDLALSVFPKDRLQSAAEWRAMITQSAEPTGTRGTLSRPTLAVDNGNSVVAEPSEPIPNLTHSKPSPGKGLYFGVAAAALLGAIGISVVLMPGGEDDGVTAAMTTPENRVENPGTTETSEVAVADSDSRKVEQVPFFLAETAKDAEETAEVAAPTAPSDVTDATTSVPSAQAAPAVPTANFTDLLADRPTETSTTPTQDGPVSTTVTSGLAATDDVQDVSSVITGQSVSFSVVADSTDPAIVASASGPIAEYLSPGVKVVSVNGFPIETLTDFQRVVLATSDPLVGDNTTLALGLEEPGTGNTYVQEVELPVSQRTMLLNGVSFETFREGDDWITIVTEGSGAGESDLQFGDKLIALMPENELIDSRDAISSVLKREISNGTQLFNFAVERGGDMWLVSMSYDVGSAN